MFDPPRGEESGHAPVETNHVPSAADWPIWSFS